MEGALPPPLGLMGPCGPKDHAPRGSFLEQKTDDEVSRKHIIDDKIGYRTKKNDPFRTT